MNPLTPRCHVCNAPLFVHEGEVLCENCTSYALAGPPRYIDTHGTRYRPAGTVPYSELTEGCRYVFPGEQIVRVRGRLGLTDLPALRDSAPWALAGLYNRPVLLLKPVPDGPDDRLVDLVDDNPPF
jgi:hypothetical protein